MRTLDLSERRVLVTGASGFIGTHLVRRLREMGCQITCLDLRPPREQLASVEYILGDVTRLGSIGIGHIDAIFNLAAVHTTPGHEDHEYYDTNVRGAQQVTEFADVTGTREIVFTSSISIYGPSEERKDESSVPAPTSAYGKSKLMAEEIHRAWLKQDNGRKLTIVRPAVVFGGGEGGNFARMASLLAKGFFIFPGRRDTIKSCIYVEDLIHLILAAGQSESKYEILNGAYPECPTLEEIVTALQRDYFPKARLIDVPRGIVLSAAKLLSLGSGLGIGVHPDRVMKLLRSTHVFPAWASERGLFKERSFAQGLEKWSKATGGTFI